MINKMVWYNEKKVGVLGTNYLYVNSLHVLVDDPYESEEPLTHEYIWYWLNKLADPTRSPDTCGPMQCKGISHYQSGIFQTRSIKIENLLVKIVTDQIILLDDSTGAPGDFKFQYKPDSFYNYMYTVNSTIAVKEGPAESSGLHFSANTTIQFLTPCDAVLYVSWSLERSLKVLWRIQSAPIIMLSHWKKAHPNKLYPSKEKFSRLQKLRITLASPLFLLPFPTFNVGSGASICFI